MTSETTEIKLIFKVIERHLEEGYGGLFIFFSLKGSRRVANGRKCVGLGRLNVSGWVPLEIDFDRRVSCQRFIGKCSREIDL